MKFDRLSRSNRVSSFAVRLRLSNNPFFWVFLLLLLSGTVQGQVERRCEGAKNVPSDGEDTNTR